MARGPFQGTFQPNARATVATAPDALVYFNGEAEVIGCPSCSRTFDFNKYVTSIQTDLSVESSPGSANISLAIPRHSIDDFYFDGNAVITPMMEVEIFAKGYYLVEGLPQYYPIFWGLVTEVGDNYSNGEHTVSIHCADILKWWELCKMNINPAFSAPAGQQGRSLVGNVFEQANPYDIIFTLASQSFGDVLVGTGSMNALIREATDKRTFNASLSDMMLYWEKRFARMRSNLVLYGASGVAVRGDTIVQEYSKQKTPSVDRPFASTAVRNANGGPDGGQMVFDPASDKVAAFKRVYANVGVGIWQSEYQTKLELANAAKEAIGYEFFMDVTGDIVFKPPFYNLDVLGNKPTSWIQDIDIIDWDFSESESEVITQIVMQGEYAGTEDVGAPHEAQPFTSVTDYHLLRKYGWRTQNYNSEFMSDPTQMFYHGLDMLDRINSRRHRGNVTIPMRPELRLGFPIYVAPKDQIWYVSGISHSIQFGGRASTTLQLTGRRSKFIAPRGIADLKLTGFLGKAEKRKEGAPKPFRYTGRQLSRDGKFKLTLGNALTMPADQSVFEGKSGAENPAEPLILRHPKTGRIMGYPNVVLAYTRPFSPSDITKQAGERSARLANPQISKQLQDVTKKRREAYSFQQQDRFTVSRNPVLQGKYLSNTYQYGLNSAGVFVYAHDTSPGGGVISEMLAIPVENLTVTDSPEVAASIAGKKGANPTALIRPVSDERGFEVIGHFAYGRRVSLKDGRLIVDSPDKVVKVDLQLALAGDLSAMLTAQSQGLTSVATGYADPAGTLATMTPEERETNLFPSEGDPKSHPNTKAPEHSDVGDQEVSNAPLGSQEQKGTQPSVEATQLSRALTLAELAVQDAQGRQDEDCVCLTGRADLAFMSSDYQVQVLSGTSALDSSNLESQSSANLNLQGKPIDAGATQLAVRNVARVEAEIAVVGARIAQLEEQERESDGDPAVTQMLTAARDTQAKLEETRATTQAELDEQRSQYTGSSNSIFTKTNSELVSRVEQFLVNLYSTLDDAHEQFESAIRGDLLPKQNADLSNLNAAGTNPPSELAPPFSAPNRYMLGDPNAAIGSAETNVNNLAKAWSDFSQDLQSNSQTRALSTQISQDKASIARLTAARDQLIKQRDSSAVVIGVDVQKQIDSFSAQIATLQQQVTNNQAKLSAIK